MRLTVQIWSIRFSGDGREIVAGAADQRMYGGL